MSNPSPPKPWERAAAAGASNTPNIMSNNLPPSSAATPLSSSTSSGAPALPDRPSTLSNVINQNASNYTTTGAYGAGASPYGASPYGASAYGTGAYGGAGYGQYGTGYSPYNRFGSSYGSMGSMYGGAYGGGYGGMYGGMGGPGMYGRMGGMPGDPNNPNSLTQSFNQSTQATFQLIEGIVGAFGGFAQMLESTYMATHSSFFAMVSVAEQFGNLRNTLGSVLGIYTLTRWLKTMFAKLTGRAPPVSAKDLTPAKFAKFSGQTLPDGRPGPTPSRKPLAFFLLAVFGLPYLMGKLIRALAKSQEEKMVGQAQPMDPSKLEFCRVLYDFAPEAGSNSVVGVDLSVKKGDMVAVLSKTDPLGNPIEWWQCRTRDGRTGYLPSPYLETIVRRVQSQLMSGPGGAVPSPPGSRAHTMTTSADTASRASTLTGLKVEDLVSKPDISSRPGDISVESFQRAAATTGTGVGN